MAWVCLCIACRGNSPHFMPSISAHNLPRDAERPWNGSGMVGACQSSRPTEKFARCAAATPGWPALVFAISISGASGCLYARLPVRRFTWRGWRRRRPPREICAGNGVRRWRSARSDPTHRRGRPFQCSRRQGGGEGPSAVLMRRRRGLAPRGARGRRGGRGQMGHFLSRGWSKDAHRFAANAQIRHFAAGAVAA